MRRLAPLFALTLMACQSQTEGLGLGAGGDAGSAAEDATVADAGGAPDAGDVACEGLSEAECAVSNCSRLVCRGCEGEPLFALCYSGEPPTCPDILCPPPCRDLDEAECEAAGDRCRADRCPACRAPDVFVTCAEPDEPPPPCPPVACPPCETLGEAECAQDLGCHRVFSAPDPAGCLCDSPGCCHQFERCAEGRFADCLGDNLACRMPAPWCEGPYVISYEGFCYEGCVLAEDCWD